MLFHPGGRSITVDRPKGGCDSLPSPTTDQTYLGTTYLYDV